VNTTTPRHHWIHQTAPDVRLRQTLDPTQTARRCDYAGHYGSNSNCTRYDSHRTLRVQLRLHQIRLRQIHGSNSGAPDEITLQTLRIQLRLRSSGAEYDYTSAMQTFIAVVFPQVELRSGLAISVSWQRGLGEVTLLWAESSFAVISKWTHTKFSVRPSVFVDDPTLLIQWRHVCYLEVEAVQWRYWLLTSGQEQLSQLAMTVQLISTHWW